jgi:hypothetical protein
MIKVRVNPSSFQSLMVCVEYFQSVFAEELIVAINNNNDGIIAANLMNSTVSVLKRSFSDMILNVSIFLFGYLKKVEIFAKNSV